MYFVYLKYRLYFQVTRFQGEEWLDEFLNYMQGTVDWINDFLWSELPKVKMFPVEGTYQAWFDFSETSVTGEELIKLFGRAGFGASPGTWFDGDAKQFARISFACPRTDIQEAFKRLKRELEKSILPIADMSEETTNSCC